jgi:hypothetical protein
MDDEPCVDHPTECNENPTLWKTLGSECLFQDTTLMLPWKLLSIIVDLRLIHRIIGLSMQGPDSLEFYPRKAIDHALSQNIKDTYDDVEKGT